MLKRALWYLQRNWRHTLLLSGIVFLLGNIIIGSISILYSTTSVIDAVKAQLGAKVTMNTELEETKEMKFVNNWERKQMVFHDSLQDLKKDERVVKVDAGFYTKDFQTVLMNGQDYNLSIFNSSVPMVMYGVDDFDFYDLQNEDITIVEGRNFTQEELENGAYVTIVNEDLRFRGEELSIANLRPVQVHDKIKAYVVMDAEELGGSSWYKEVELEVIGIFHAKESALTIDVYYNDVGCISARNYVPYSTLRKLYEQEKVWAEEYAAETSYAKEPKLWATPVMYEVSHVDYAEQFAQDVRDKIKQDVHDLECAVKADASDFENVAPSVVSMRRIAQYTLMIATILAAVIISLTMFMFMKQRTYEVGILMALGEKKTKIVLQSMIEALIVAYLGLTLSLPSGYVISKTLTETMGMKDKEVVEIIESEEMIITKEQIGMMYGWMTGIVMIAILLPSGYIVSMKPKKVLLDG